MAKNRVLYTEWFYVKGEEFTTVEFVVEQHMSRHVPAITLFFVRCSAHGDTIDQSIEILDAIHPSEAIREAIKKIDVIKARYPE